MKSLSLVSGWQLLAKVLLVVLQTRIRTSDSGKDLDMDYVDIVLPKSLKNNNFNVLS